MIHLPPDMAPWLGWMVFAVILAIGELVLPGIFLIWIAIGAAITGGLAFLVPLSVPVQVLVFAGLCLVATWAGRRWYKDNPVASSDPLLNDRAARLVGRSVIVVDPIVNGEGRVRVDDGTWSALGPEAGAGMRLVVVAVEGASLHVAWPAT